MSNKTRILKATALAVTCTLADATVLAQAQTGSQITGMTPSADAKTVSVLEEVLVSATKTGETSVQDTPIAVSAFDRTYLEQLVIADIRDLAQVTPGLTISDNIGRAQIYIRGIGTNQVFAGGDPSSTVHIDGVYVARPMGAFNNFLDVERIEVLRGPQGTLYGRNSVGGTINVISRRPSLESLDARAQVTAGNYDLFRLEGYVSGPVVEERLALSLAAQRSKRDAFRENINPSGNDLDDEDSVAFRGQMLWKIAEGAELLLRGDHYESEATPYGPHTFVVPPNAPLAATIFGDQGKVATSFPHFSDQETSGVSGELNIDLGDRWTAKSLTAYRELDFLVGSDSDVSELNLLEFVGGEDQDQLSQELNFVGNYDGMRLLLGLFYMREQIDVIGPGLRNRGTGINRRATPKVDTVTWAAFGEGRWQFADRWAAILGVRYTDEEKEFSKIDGVYSLATGALLTNLSFPTETGNYQEFTPKVGLEFEPNEDLLLYVTASEGFKSGGFNFTALRPGGYDPEELRAYELGLKSDLLGQRLRINAAAFFYDYENLQVQAFIVPGQTDVTNAATAEVKGVEVELTARPIPGLDVALVATWLDATYDQYPAAPIPGGATIDASGKRLNAAPEFAGSLRLQYTHPIAAGSVYVAGEYSHQSEVFYTVDNNSLDRQATFGLLNATLGVTLNQGHWDLALWGRNLSDEEYVTSTVQFPPPGRTGRAGWPRTYGVRANWSF